jgi:hypothetical protein
MMQTIKAGDFASLANDYSQNYPDCCLSVFNALIGLHYKPVTDIDAGFCDVVFPGSVL